MSIKAFDIKISGLKDGLSVYTFEVDASFFSLFEYSPIEDGSLKVTIELEKTDTLYKFNFDLAGTVKRTCDRCLQPVDLPLKGQFGLLAKVTASQEEENDEIIYIPPHEDKINVAHHIYEHINLSLPIRQTCEDSLNEKECDSEVIEKLNSLTHKEDQTDDPRWAKLKELK